MNINKIIVTVLFLVYVILVFMPFFFGKYHININIKFLISFIIFTFLVVIYMTKLKIKYLQFFFPIIILNVPGAIDNIFPSFKSDIMLNNNIYISPISYLDIFIISFLLITLFNNKKTFVININFYKYIFIFSFFIYLLNYILYFIYQDFLFNSYGGLILFLRFLFFLYIVDIIFIHRNINISYFYAGFLISIILLIIDSLIYTKIFMNLEELTHSTFANNVFTNLLVFIYAINRVIFKKNNLFIFIIFLLIAIVASARAAILYLILSEILFYFFYQKNILKKIVLFMLLLPISLLVYEKILFYIHNINSGVFLPELSSIYTRLTIWKISFDMFVDNIFTGVGYWCWNNYKYTYGFLTANSSFTDTKTISGAVLLDAHNGYLHILSEFGIIIFILFYSIFFYFIKKNKLLISLPIIIWMCTELSNAGVNKIQIIMYILFWIYLIDSKLKKGINS